jgi:hypothetical protein
MADEPALTTDTPEVARIWVAYRLTNAMSGFWRSTTLDTYIGDATETFAKVYKAVDKATRE